MSHVSGGKRSSSEGRSPPGPCVHVAGPTVCLQEQGQAGRAVGSLGQVKGVSLHISCSLPLWTSGPGMGIGLALLRSLARLGAGAGSLHIWPSSYYVVGWH